MTTRPTFEDRLALARVLIARGAPAPPLHIADQLAAAGDEATVLHNRLGATLPLLEPDRDWRHRLDPDPSDDTRALLLAAVLDCVSCCHLRQGGPQPAVVQLPLRRIDCSRCVGTLRRPPPDESDRCDSAPRAG